MKIVEALRVRKALKMKRRIENVERARREQEHRNKVVVKKLEMQWGRMHKMKEIEEAVSMIYYNFQIKYFYEAFNLTIFFPQFFSLSP
jgi:uncharacterized membrane protein